MIYFYTNAVSEFVIQGSFLMLVTEKMRLKPNRYLLIIIVVFGIIYSLISLVNHYNFRTYALDLGAYTNALYDYIHFQWNDSTAFKEASENLLADHFDLYLILFSPLSLIFKTYTLLLVQIFFILLGGYGVYKFFMLSEKTSRMAIFAALYFYLFFGVFAALSYDYHSNVVAAVMLPWFFYFVKKRELLPAGLMLLFIIVSKENISLWIAFVSLGLAFEYRKEPRVRNFLLVAFVFAIVYFVTVLSVVMPWFSNSNAYPHFHYSALGNSTPEALAHLFQHPVDSFKILFINHNNTLHGDYVKLELHLLLLLSGLPLLIFKPQYFLMLIPIYFQKLFHDNYIMWGISGQYSIEFAPVLATGIFLAISDFKNTRLMKASAVVVVIAAFLCTFRTMDNTVFFTSKSKIRFYQSIHYTRDYDVKNVHQQLSEIPKDAIVSAQSPFLPHLALRDNIYQFPVINDADYIVYSEKEKLYPLNQKTFMTKKLKLETSGDWLILYQDDGFTVLKRRNK